MLTRKTLGISRGLRGMEGHPAVIGRLTLVRKIGHNSRAVSQTGGQMAGASMTSAGEAEDRGWRYATGHPPSPREPW